MKKIMLAIASLAVIAAPVAASAQSYGHGGARGGGWSNRGDYGHSYRGGGNAGAAVAAGVFGLILGSAIASSYHSNGYGYAQPYGYAQNCEWRNQAYNTGYGEIAYRQVEVCR